MASRYDNTRYLPTLIHEVRAFGIETDPDSINRMSEIINSSPINALLHYASGEDMFGDKPRSAEDKKEAIANQTALYTILFYVWGWQKTIEFYMRHAASETKRNQKLRDEVNSLQAQNKALKETMRAQSGNNAKIAKEIEDLEADLRARDEEILRLKARLYDLLEVAEKGESE